MKKEKKKKCFRVGLGRVELDLSGGLWSTKK